MSDEIEERRVRAFEMLKAGGTVAAIATRFEITEEEALLDLRVMLDRAAVRQRETDYDTLSLERLDSLNRSVWLGAMRGDPQAAEVALATAKYRDELVEKRSPRTPAQRLQSKLDALLARHGCNDLSALDDTPVDSPTEQQEITSGEE